MRLRSGRTCSPSVVAGLTLHGERVLVEDVHSDADRLFTSRANQSGFMNGGYQ